MKSLKWLSALVAAAVISTAPVAYAAVDEQTCDINDPYCHRFTKAEEYFKQLNPNATEEEWLQLREHLRVFTDPARMAAVMGDPVKFAEWMAALSDPDAVHLMMRCSQEPIMWNTWLRNFSNPDLLFKAGVVFVNPLTYLQWMVAPVNTQVYAKLAPLVSSELWADWGNKATTLKFYEPLYSWVDPQWTVDRVNWAFDPNTYGNLFYWFTQVFAGYGGPTTAALTQ